MKLFLKVLRRNYCDMALYQLHLIAYCAKKAIFTSVTHIQEDESFRGGGGGGGGGWMFGY